MDNSLLNSTFYKVDISPAPDKIHNLIPFFLTGTALKGCNSSEFVISEDNNLQRAMYSGLALLSIVSSTIVATVIFYNEKLRIHPSKLIGYMCICEAASCFSALIWVINPKSYICYFGIHYLWNYTTG